MSIGEAFGNAFGALLSLQVLFVIAVYAAIYWACMIGSSLVLSNAGMLGPLGGLLSGAIVQGCLFPVVLAALVAYTLGYPERGLQFGYAFGSFGSLALSGLLGLVFALGISFIPIVGGLIRNSQTVFNVVSAIPPVIAVFASQAGVGAVVSGSLSLLLEDWWFLVILVLMTKALEFVAFIVVGLLTSQSQSAMADDSDRPPLISLLVAAVIPFFPAMVLINRVAGYLAEAIRG